MTEHLIKFLTAVKMTNTNISFKGKLKIFFNLLTIKSHYRHLGHMLSLTLTSHCRTRKGPLLSITYQAPHYLRTHQVHDAKAWGWCDESWSLRAGHPAYIPKWQPGPLSSWGALSPPITPPKKTSSPPLASLERDGLYEWWADEGRETWSQRGDREILYDRQGRGLIEKFKEGNYQVMPEVGVCVGVGGWGGCSSISCFGSRLWVRRILVGVKKIPAGGTEGSGRWTVGTCFTEFGSVVVTISKLIFFFDTRKQLRNSICYWSDLFRSHLSYDIRCSDTQCIISYFYLYTNTHTHTHTSTQTRVYDYHPVLYK